MNSISSAMHAKYDSIGLDRYFMRLQQQRAKPLVRFIFLIGIGISLFMIFVDWFVAKENVWFNAQLRIALALSWASLLLLTFSRHPIWRMQIELSLITAVAIASIALPMIYLAEKETAAYMLPSLSLCLFAMVVVQIGVRLVFITSALCWLMPSTLMFLYDIPIDTMIMISISLLIWCCAGILATFILDNHNRKLFIYERRLHDMNRSAMKAHDEEIKASQAKSRFLANMSHEIRTPLTAIMGYAETLKRDRFSYRQLKEAVNIIYRNGEYLMSIINDILDLSKVEAGQLKMESIAFSLPETLAVVESLVSKIAKEKNVHFETSFEWPIPEVIVGDPIRFRQIILNLCSNACKFSPEGKVKLSISANRNLKVLIVKVRDNGIGMDDTTIARIFRPFTQADASTTRKFGGTGLGLHISQQLAKRMGGDIKVSSTPGKGSEFTFYMPLNHREDIHWLDHIDDTLVHDVDRDAYKIPKLQGRILVAEDQLDNQHLIEHIIKLTGAEVEFASNGEEAVQKALANDYHLVLMDIQMPVLDGLEATDLLKKSGFESPIVALSANVMTQDIEKYQRVGCADWLAKPIDREPFYKTLAKYVPGKGEYKTIDEDLPILDEQTIKKMADEYLERLREDLKLLKHNVEDHQYDDVKKIAHRIKGSSGNFQYTHVSDNAATIEQLINFFEEAVELEASQLEHQVKEVLEEQTHG